jgi:nucleoside-diphosphate-sugar epimerase
MGNKKVRMSIFVTGGGGFLGSAIVRALCSRGYEVVSFSRGDHPHLKSMGVRTVRGDISDYPRLKEAMAGSEGVFHVAAKTGISIHEADFYRTNVTGTENVLRACRALQIRHLVFTSSPSVVFTGRDSSGQNESLPYASRHLAAYPRTKALAEEMVMKANDNALKTVSLRPHLIWGPGDPYYLPALMEKAKKGRLFHLGRSANLVDCVYIDNAVRAHLLAFDKLQSNTRIVEGKVYFISQGDPIPISEFVNQLLAAAGMPPVSAHLPPVVARLAGRLLETVYRRLRLPGEPPLTLFLALQMSTAHWYDISAARRDLGYAPEVSIEEGMKRLREWMLLPGDVLPANS